MIAMPSMRAEGKKAKANQFGQINQQTEKLIVSRIIF